MRKIAEVWRKIIQCVQKKLDTANSNLEEAGVANDVADPQEEDGGEHGQGDRGQDSLDNTKPFSLLGL